MKKFNLKLHNQKGFTLIELIVVIAILSILGGIAIPKFGGFTEKAKFRADQANIKILNDATTLYALKENKDLTDIITDDLGENGAKLVATDYLESTPSPQSKEAQYLWNQEQGMWVLDIDGGSKLLKTDCNNILYHNSNDNWTIKDGKLKNNKTGQQRIFFPNDYEQYEITTKAQFISGEGSVGYGIIFESVVEQSAIGKSANDTGYVFQFDPGLGNKFAFYKRTNGGESNKHIIDPSREISNDANWWKAPHDIKINVTKVNDSEKDVMVYIDGNPISTEAYKVESSDTEKQRYVGFRTWNKSHAEFTNPKIKEIK
ncbi:competence type IV pilus major pilin ComGC [Crassaminicella profunda]|uniref:competence type IV pilus major pilin ComGC n=1 Tax=Crassaminicella profunda TaxID=1286698 RepID=UPI001CA73724|nr:type II secretion system protein [Crassaminicella profunda]QZY56985.1 type II secretion system GspH family protein [Crassaminicella profunda]